MLSSTPPPFVGLTPPPPRPSHLPVKENSQHTIGVEFQSRTIQIGEKKVKLQVSSNESQKEGGSGQCFEGRRLDSRLVIELLGSPETSIHGTEVHVGML